MVCHAGLVHMLSIKTMASTMVSDMITGIEATRQRHTAILPHVKKKVFCNSQVFCFPVTDFSMQQSKVFVRGCSTGSEPTINSIIKLAGYDPNSLTAHHLRHSLTQGYSDLISNFCFWYNNNKADDDTWLNAAGYAGKKSWRKTHKTGEIYVYSRWFLEYGPEMASFRTVKWRSFWSNELFKLFRKLPQFTSTHCIFSLPTATTSTLLLLMEQKLNRIKRTEFPKKCQNWY